MKSILLLLGKKALKTRIFISIEKIRKISKHKVKPIKF